MDRSEKAVELFKSGYNCAQSVFAAFADQYDIDEKTALKLSSSFGAGMGRMREVCGAVSGMMLIAGMETGPTDNNNREGKIKNYEMARKLANEFKQENGSIICRELLGLSKNDREEWIPSERTKAYYQKRPCVELVRMAAKILEQELEGSN